MEGYGETCQLCGTDGLDLDKGKGDELTEKDHLETFKFLSGEMLKKRKTAMFRHNLDRSSQGSVF